MLTPNRHLKFLNAEELNSQKEARIKLVQFVYCSKDSLRLQRINEFDWQESMFPAESLFDTSACDMALIHGLHRCTSLSLISCCHFHYGFRNHKQMLFPLLHRTISMNPPHAKSDMWFLLRQSWVRLARNPRSELQNWSTEADNSQCCVHPLPCSIQDIVAPHKTKQFFFADFVFIFFLGSHRKCVIFKATWSKIQGNTPTPNLTAPCHSHNANSVAENIPVWYTVWPPPNVLSLNRHNRKIGENQKWKFSFFPRK